MEELLALSLVLSFYPDLRNVIFMGQGEASSSLSFELCNNERHWTNTVIWKDGCITETSDASTGGSLKRLSLAHTILKRLVSFLYTDASLNHLLDMKNHAKSIRRKLGVIEITITRSCDLKRTGWGGGM